MKTWKVKTTKDVDTVQADEMVTSQVDYFFLVKEEQTEGMIFTGESKDKVIKRYPYSNVISVEEVDG